MTGSLVATLKLFTLPECVAGADPGRLPPAWREGVIFAMQGIWGDGSMRCLVCDEEIGHCAAYAAVIIPQDALTAECACYSGGVCASCGSKHARSDIYTIVQRHALLSLGEAGHA